MPIHKKNVSRNFVTDLELKGVFFFAANPAMAYMKLNLGDIFNTWKMHTLSLKSNKSFHSQSMLEM